MTLPQWLQRPLRPDGPNYTDGEGPTMGSRASYVVKKDGQAKAYGSHWGASSILDDLMWGPDYATKAFESQTELEELAEIEGGDEGYALVDWDARRMIWFSANCELPVQQRLYNRLLAANWPGWTIDLAVHGIADLLDHLGVSPAEETDEDVEEEDVEEEDVEEEDVEEEDIEDDLVFTPTPVTGPVANIEDIQSGNWLSIRGTDGSYRDYFGFPDELHECLCEGESLIERLRQCPSLEAPPPELPTTGGAIIDQQNRVLWRWDGPRYAWQERPLRKAWDGWTLKDLSGQWQGQMQATGRDAGGLAGGDRQLLGATVAGLLTDSSIDPLAALSKIATIGHGLRMGCAGITLAVGIAVGGLALWLRSAIVTVLASVAVGICLLLTLWLWRKTAVTLGVLDIVNEFPKDRPMPQGLKVEEKRRILNGVLARSGYPTIEELEAAGELPKPFASDDED
jgi:hypothetical protein